MTELCWQSKKPEATGAVPCLHRDRQDIEHESAIEKMRTLIDRIESVRSEYPDGFDNGDGTEEQKKKGSLHPMPGVLTQIASPIGDNGDVREEKACDIDNEWRDLMQGEWNLEISSSP
jgi:hypothetical protein